MTHYYKVDRGGFLGDVTQTHLPSKIWTEAICHDQSFPSLFTVEYMILKLISWALADILELISTYKQIITMSR